MSSMHIQIIATTGFLTDIVSLILQQTGVLIRTHILQSQQVFQLNAEGQGNCQVENEDNADVMKYRNGIKIYEKIQ